MHFSHALGSAPLSLNLGGWCSWGLPPQGLTHNVRGQAGTRAPLRQASPERSWTHPPTPHTTPPPPPSPPLPPPRPREETPPASCLLQAPDSGPRSLSLGWGSGGGRSVGRGASPAGRLGGAGGVSGGTGQAGLLVCLRGKDGAMWVPLNTHRQVTCEPLNTDHDHGWGVKHHPPHLEAQTASTRGRLQAGQRGSHGHGQRENRLRVGRVLRGWGGWGWG